jgi:hypothetical protein
MLFHDDDILHPKYLELAINAINTDPNIAMVLTRYKEFFNDKIPLLDDTKLMYLILYLIIKNPLQIICFIMNISHMQLQFIVLLIF